MKQLRPFHSPERLAEIYSKPYSHDQWEEHKARIAASVDELTWLKRTLNPFTFTDLSCGDGAVLAGLHERFPETRMTYGDMVPHSGGIVPRAAQPYRFVGPIETGLDEMFSHFRRTDVFVCSETLEHVEDPQGLLDKISRVVNYGLFLTTPLDEPETSDNEEHYWTWSGDDVTGMLIHAGFDIFRHVQWRMPFYTYGVWHATLRGRTLHMDVHEQPINRWPT